MRTWSITLLLAALALAMLTACGSEDLSPQAAVAQAATKTADAGSSRVAYDVTMSGGAVPQEIQMEGEGAFDYEHRRGETTMEMPPPLAGEMKMIMDGLVLYMQLPQELRKELPTPKPWLKLDLAKAGNAAGIDLEALVQTDQTDPTQTLNYLRGASNEVEEVGEEDVRGTPTTHYRATVDLRKAIDEAAGAVPEGERDRVRKAIEGVIEQTGVESMPMDVWIDEDGRARRLAMDYTMTMGGAGKVRMQMAIDYFDFGVEVDVEPPPAGQTMDISELAAEGS